MNKFTIQESFAISAGAGSGKTYTLSRRYINAVLGFDFFNDDKNYFENKDKLKADIEEIVTITYTKAAASEMKERIFSLMKAIIEENEEIKKDLDKLDENQKKYVKDRLNFCLTKINTAKISTIHSFAFDLIRENSDFLKLDSKIEIVDDLQKEKIFDESYYDEINKDKSLAIEISNYISLFKLKELAKKYVFDSKFREYFDKFENDIEFFKSLHREFHKLDDEIVKNADEEIAGIKKWYESLINYSNLIKFNEFIKNQIGEKLNYNKKFHQENYSKVRIFRDLLDENLFSIDKEKEEKFTTLTKNIKKFLKNIYTTYKDKLHPNLDFDLVIQKFHELTSKKEIKFKYIMIDEFQDTNSLQYEIIKQLKYDNLFIVGDEKQSIYSFQGGEIEVFKNAQKTLKVEPMNVNYRSDKKIIKFINDVFKEIFNQEELPIENNFSATYEPLEANSKDDGKIELLVTNVEKDEDKTTKEAQNIALLVKEILETNKYPALQKYIDKKEKTIGILYDSKADMKILKEELNNLGIDCKVNGGDNFWDTEEIKDMFAFLKVIFDDDKFYLARVLESLGYDDKEIVEFIKNNKKFDEIKCDELHTCIQKVYMKLFKKYQNPAQAQANVEKLIEEVIKLNQKCNYDKKIVLEILEDNFLNSETQNAFFEAENSEVVELCSIHYTKGLAYPMVILTSAHKDISNQGDKIFSFEKFKIDDKQYFAFGTKIDDYSPISRRVASKIQKLKHIEEKKRLLYVALTRAKHNIVISYIEGENKPNSYYSWMEKYLKNLPIIKLNSTFKQKTLNKEVEFDIYEKIEFKKEKEFFSKSAILGTCVHKIIELYHNDLSTNNIDKIIKRYNLEDKKESIYKMIENFKSSKVYKEIQKADEVYFELPFVADENGRIDLAYKIDNKFKIIDFKTGKQKDYTAQLEKYKKVLSKFGEVEAELLYLGEEK